MKIEFFLWDWELKVEIDAFKFCDFGISFGWLFWVFENGDGTSGELKIMVRKMKQGLWIERRHTCSVQLPRDLRRFTTHGPALPVAMAALPIDPVKEECSLWRHRSINPIHTTFHWPTLAAEQPPWNIIVHSGFHEFTHEYLLAQL